VHDLKKELSMLQHITGFVVVFLTLLVVLVPRDDSVASEPAGSLLPDLPYQAEKSNPVTYDVDFAVIVTAPYHTKQLRVWLPMPQSDSAQQIEDGELSSYPMSVKPRVEKEPKFGNRLAYFEFAKPEGAQIIRHRFKVTAYELRWGLDPTKVAKVDHWPSSFDPYLKSDGTVVVNDRLQQLTHEFIGNSHNEAVQLDCVMGWVNKNMRYDHSVASLRASSEHAITERAGHCSDYHGLCAAFGRALGFPTRITYGMNTFPKNSPSHCKLEAFLPPYGWVSFDVSETQKLIGDIQKAKDLDEPRKEQLIRAAQNRLRRGFRDNTWFVQTRGTDYDLAPPAARRVTVVRTAYIEADGLALPDPDPANPKKKEFAWMTMQTFKPDKPVDYPFKNWQSLTADAPIGQ
jgi:transglutaminase-like putative cysteine protease